jgi:hypothetical protein
LNSCSARSDVAFPVLNQIGCTVGNDGVHHRGT